MELLYIDVLCAVYSRELIIDNGLESMEIIRLSRYYGKATFIGTVNEKVKLNRYSYLFVLGRASMALDYRRSFRSSTVGLLM